MLDMLLASDTSGYQVELEMAITPIYQVTVKYRDSPPHVFYVKKEQTGMLDMLLAQIVCSAPVHSVTTQMIDATTGNPLEKPTVVFSTFYTHFAE